MPRTRCQGRGNVINPTTVGVRADSLRLYEMFMGPLEAVKPWNMHGVEGVYRFLGRVWRLIVDDAAETLKLQRRRSRTSSRTSETLRRAAPHDPEGDRGPRRRCASTPPSRR